MAEGIEIEVNTYNYDVYDADFNELPLFVAEMRGVARRWLGTDGENGFMEFFFG